MIDLLSVLAGVVAGGGIGFIAGTVLTSRKVDEYEGMLDELIEKYSALSEEHTKIYREYSRITDRNARGQFTKKEKP